MIKSKRAEIGKWFLLPVWIPFGVLCILCIITIWLCSFVLDAIVPEKFADWLMRKLEILQ